MQFSIRKGELVKAEADLLVLNLFEGTKELQGASGDVDKALNGLLSEIIKEEKFEATPGSSLLIRPHDFCGCKKVLLVGLGKPEEFSEEIVRQAAAVSASEAKRLQIKHLISILHGAGNGKLPAKICAKAIAEGTALATYEYSKHKSEKKKKQELEVFEIVSHNPVHVREAKKGIELGEIYSRATILARDLVNEPASYMRPADLVDAAKKVVADNRGALRIKIYDRAALQRMGAGGILSVARGSDYSPFMVHLVYLPKKKTKKKIALVGKALTYDSGGISLKSSEHLVNMKCDMAGAAAVIGVFSALAELGIKHEVHGIFAACENMPSGRALVPGDVIKVMNKKTIEVLNTDAEGRLTLADTLTFAKRQKPDFMIDVATLTGACMIALGEEIAGVMSNRSGLAQEILSAAKIAGEKLWELPLEKNYKQLLKSEIADLKNIGGKYGGTLTAGLFLQEFVGEVPWAHLDIAGPAFAEKPLNIYTKYGGTGFGVRTLLEIVGK